MDREAIQKEIKESIKEIGYYPTKVKFGPEEFYYYLCKNPEEIELFFVKGFESDELEKLSQSGLSKTFLDVLLSRKLFSALLYEKLIESGITKMELERHLGLGGYEPATIIMFMYFRNTFSKEESLNYINKFIVEIEKDKLIETGFIERYQMIALVLYRTFLLMGDTKGCNKIFNLI